MSGTRTIKAEEIKLLADFPIVGPTDGNELVSQSSTFKLGNLPSQLVLGFPTQTVLANNTKILDFTLPPSPFYFPFFPSDEVPSCYNQLPNPTATAAPMTLVFTGLKALKGSVVVNFSLSTAAAAATTPEGKFVIRFTQNVTQLPGVTTVTTLASSQTIATYNDTLYNYSATFPFFVGYDADIVQISFQIICENTTSSLLTLSTIATRAYFVLE